MKLISKSINLEVKGGEVVLHEEVANRLGINYGDRINIRTKNKTMSAFVGISCTLVSEQEIGVFSEAMNKLGLKDGDEVDISPSKKPVSVSYIKKKIKGEKLTQKEINSLIQDVVNDKLTNTEIAAYLTAIEINEMSIDETHWLTQAMVDSGEKIEFDDYPILDKHSIGGVPGNKISLLIIPIVASAGFKIPKTSSRAITGVAGTADIMEVLADVKFSAKEIKEITEEVGGVLAWGGATNISPADDVFVRVEHPLSLDPRPQLLASVLSKKKAIGSDKVVIDIPTGDGAKVENKEKASKLSREFIELGKRLGMEINCAITYGGSPIGEAIGPALEAKEALMALEGKKKLKSLLEKSCSIAGLLLEMADEFEGNNGKERAKEILKNGDALEKFKEILDAQNGDSGIESEDIAVGEFQKEIKSPSSGYVTNLRTKKLVSLARSLGAPDDKGAGLKVLKKEGDEVDKGDCILKLFSEEEWRLNESLEVIKKDFPLDIEGMVLKKIPEFEEVDEIKK